MASPSPGIGSVPGPSGGLKPLAFGRATTGIARDSEFRSTAALPLYADATPPMVPKSLVAPHAPEVSMSENLIGRSNMSGLGPRPLAPADFLAHAQFNRRYSGDRASQSALSTMKQKEGENEAERREAEAKVTGASSLPSKEI